jgi:hypothetical protein
VISIAAQKILSELMNTTIAIILVIPIVPFGTEKPAFDQIGFST